MESFNRSMEFLNINKTESQKVSALIYISINIAGVHMLGYQSISQYLDIFSVCLRVINGARRQKSMWNTLSFPLLFQQSESI